MNSNLQFLQKLQKKKTQLKEDYKHLKVDLQKIEHQIQTPSVKTEQQRIQITQQEFIYLVKATKSKLAKQPSLLRLQGPIYVCTGTHGSYLELGYIFDKCEIPRFVNYLFLGNYTGKYERGIQCLVALMTYKIKYSLNFFLLRGTLETIEYSKASTLYTEILKYFGSPKAWIEICELFCFLPFAAVVNERIFCVHGGICPFLFTFQQINQISRPFNTPEKGLPHQLVFGDLSLKKEDMDKGPYFGQAEVEGFIKRTGTKMVCRAKSIAEFGYEFVFNKQLVNLCSVSNFCSQYSNSGAVMMIDDQFNVIFKQISTGTSQKNVENQDDLDLMEYLMRKKQRQSRMVELEKIESQKQVNQMKEMEQNKIERQKKQQNRRKKEESRKLRKLKSEMIQEKQIKVRSHKLEESLNEQN